MSFAQDSVNKRGAGATWYHEHGHLADHSAGYVSHNKAYSDALREDFVQYTAKIQKEKGLAFREWSYGSITKRLHSSYQYHAISDLYDAISEGACSGLARHDRNYWKSPHALGEEAFAHMFEASFDPQKSDLMKEFFPSAFSMFESMIGDDL